MSEIAIKAENISKKYVIGSGSSGSLRETLSNSWHRTFGGNRTDEEVFWALQDINFEIKQGEAVGIIGRNGAGKSTLLKLLSKITYPTTGKITMNGRVSSLLEVGTGFHPELTGRENIFLNGTILGMSHKEVKSKFDEIVDFSGIEKFLDTPVKRYSSGMYVRLAFAVAAHLEPEILIIDEVLAVGDAEFQKKCLGKMNEVAKGGRTVLFVSHNMGIIQQLCDKALFLYKGKKVLYDNTNSAIEKYLSYDIISSYSFNQKTDKELYFKSIEINNNHSEIKLTKDVVIDLLIQKNIINSTNEIEISVTILDRLRNRVFSSIENINQHTSGSEKEDIKLKLRIPGNTLVPGYYSMEFKIYIPPGNQIFDYIDNGFHFNIIDTGTKFSKYSNYGSVFVNCKWE